MSIEKQMADDRRDSRKKVLTRRVLHLLRDTVILEGVSADTKVEDVMARMSDDSAKVIAPLIEALDILEEIIWASDGCQGHAGCQHSMEPWQRARALLRPKWESIDYRTPWPPDPRSMIGSGNQVAKEHLGHSAHERSAMTDTNKLPSSSPREGAHPTSEGLSGLRDRIIARLVKARVRGSYSEAQAHNDALECAERIVEDIFEPLGGSTGV